MSMRFSTSRTSADRHGNALGRATIEQTDDSFPMQQVQTKNFFQEAMDDIEHVHPYGFSARPKKPDMMGGIKRAAEAFFSFLGGNRSHGVIVVTGDRRYRLFQMQEGEVALHDDQGHQVHLTRGGIIFSAPNSKKIMMQIMQSDTLPQQSSGTSQSQTSGGGGQYGQTPQNGQPTVATLQKDKNQFAVNHPVKSQITAPQNIVQGTNTAQITAPTVQVQGTTETDVSAPTVNISGTSVVGISAPSVGITGSLTVNGVPYTGGGGGGSGTVLSVAMTVPAGLAVSGSPITTSGTLGITWSGTIPNAQIPAPTVSALGGIKANAGSAHQWVASINTDASVTLTQPAFTDISGSVAAAQMPALTGDVTTTAGAVVTTIGAGAVTLAKQASLAANSIIGNNTGSPATPLALTGAQVEQMLLITQGGTGAVQRTLDAKIKGDVWVSVIDFGADPTGVIDSTTFIQDAINYVASLGGGRVYLPPGNYKISSTLTIGNGTSTAWSTVNGVILEGAGCPKGIFTSSSSTTMLTWAGATSGFPPMITIQGPLSGWGVRNLGLNCANALTCLGILAYSASFGFCENLWIGGCWNGIHTKVFDQGSLTGVPNSMHNSYRNISISLHDQTGGTAGFTLTGSGNSTVTTNTCYERLDNITIGSDGVVNFVCGVYLQVCDSVEITDLHCAFAGSSSPGIYWDYSVNSAYPNSCQIFGADPGAGGMTANGTSTLGLNVVHGLMEGNGAVPVVLSGVSYGIASLDGKSIQGTSTNDNAPAGCVGELISATASGVAISGGSPGTPVNVASILLQAGDYDVSAACQHFVSGISTTSLVALQGSISSTSATVDNTDTREANVLYPSGSGFASAARFMVGPSRFSLPSATTVYLVAQIAGSYTGTATVGGTIRARRKR